MRVSDRFRAASAAFKGKSLSTRQTVELNQLLDFLGIDRSAGQSMGEATYYACIKVLSEGIGKLPLKVQQYTPEHGIRIAREHPFYRMLNERPNRYMSASVFWSTMELCRNHYGNAYAWIDTRDPRNPQLWIMNPNEVALWYDDKLVLGDVPDVYYQYCTPGGVIVFKSEDVLHFKAHNTRDGLVGIPVREQLSEPIQGNIKAQRMVNKMYESGMTAKAVLQYTGQLSDRNVDALVKGVKQYASGELKDTESGNIIPLPTGMTLTPLNMKLADSQFLELRRHTAMQIASAFGVMPYQVGDYTKSSYASAEAQQLSFLVDTLLYIVKQYEEEIGAKLLSDIEVANGYHVKFNTAVILRADQQTQIQTLAAAVQSFLMTPNEAREKLDLPNKPGGDQLLGNGASIPVQFAGSQYTNISGKEDKAWINDMAIQLADMMVKKFTGILPEQLTNPRA